MTVNDLPLINHAGWLVVISVLSVVAMLLQPERWFVDGLLMGNGYLVLFAWVSDRIAIWSDGREERLASKGVYK